MCVLREKVKPITDPKRNASESNIQLQSEMENRLHVRIHKYLYTKHKTNQ